MAALNTKVFIKKLFAVKNPVLGDEGYHLHVTRDSITIEANTDRGIQYGAITLDQNRHHCC
jgi:N-acetyl-beta-hexosaminidase